VAEDLLDDADVDTLLSINRVAAVWRASWTRASRTPDCLRMDFHCFQSSVRSMGPPGRVVIGPPVAGLQAFCRLGLLVDAD
jgi:hypothetical protein